MKRIALLAVLMSVSSTAFASGSIRISRTHLNALTGINGPFNGRSANGVRNNSGLPNGRGTVLDVEGASGLKAPHARARNGRLFVR